MVCEHANECPQSCSCPGDCYCRLGSKMCPDISTDPEGFRGEGHPSNDEHTKKYGPPISGTTQVSPGLYVANQPHSVFVTGISKVEPEISDRVNSHAQPAPVANNHPNIKDLVLKDILDRVQFGFNKYGQYLKPHNGRDVLYDIYQEQLDALMYIRQAIFERDGK